MGWDEIGSIHRLSLEGIAQGDLGRRHSNVFRSCRVMVGRGRSQEVGGERMIGDGLLGLQADGVLVVLK